MTTSLLASLLATAKTNGADHDTAVRIVRTAIERLSKGATNE